MIAGLLLAAGFGRRFGGDKLVADLRGKPLIRWSVDVLRASVDIVHVVVPPNAVMLRKILSAADVHVVENPDRDEGMASSIRAGVGALADDVEAVLLALGDEPFVQPSVIARVIALFREGGADAVVPVYRGVRGHPVLFARSCFSALQAISGDTGARQVLADLGAGCRMIQVDDDAPVDVDEEHELELLRASPDARSQ